MFYLLTLRHERGQEAILTAAGGGINGHFVIQH